MAPATYTHIIRIAIAIAFTSILALLLPLFILPLLPLLRPFVAQLLMRLRDVFAFLAFTTIIAVGIFSTQRKVVDTEKTPRKPFLEHHPLSSIFGDHVLDGATHADECKDHFHDKPASVKKVDTCVEYHDDTNVVDYSTGKASAMVNGAPKMEVLCMENVPTRTHGSLVHRKLHRRSSSLDDGVNCDPDSEAVTPQKHVTTTVNGDDSSKSTRRVSFSISSSIYSDEFVLQDDTPKQDRVEKQIEMSPGDLTRQADAFIAKFKEQIRMQRLESSRRRVS